MTYIRSRCQNEQFSQEDAITFAKETLRTDNVEARFVVRATRLLRDEVPDPVRYEQTIAARLTKVGGRYQRHS
jgi:hypothetical protein